MFQTVWALVAWLGALATLTRRGRRHWKLCDSRMPCCHGFTSSTKFYRRCRLLRTFECALLPPCGQNYEMFNGLFHAFGYICMSTNIPTNRSSETQKWVSSHNLLENKTLCLLWYIIQVQKMSEMTMIKSDLHPWYIILFPFTPCDYRNCNVVVYCFKN